MFGEMDIFVSALFTLVLIQLMKVVWAFTRKGGGWKEIWADGGVVSAHSGIVSALCFSVYFEEGFSNLFFVSLVFAMIVLRDSIGVRRIVRENASILDKKFRLKRKVREGHSLLEIFLGVAVGAIVSTLVIVV